MTLPNGQTGLLSDPSWVLIENSALRDELAAERERRRIAEEQFRLLEDRLERNGHE